MIAVTMTKNLMCLAMDVGEGFYQYIVSIRPVDNYINREIRGWLLKVT